MKPMLPVLKWSLPDTGKWAYEIKYDGYRAILDWTKGGMRLWTRNGKDLLPQGLQVYIPLPDGQFSWEDTRLFTEFMAAYFVSKSPEHFTIERMKKKRGGKLYVDFVQHAEGKTIIAPYSMRGHEDALVAAPLFWKEVNASLSPDHFTIETVLSRVDRYGCPFARFFACKNGQPFAPVLAFLKQNKGRPI